MYQYTLQDIVRFINEHHVATVATVDISGTPHAATVFCLMNADGILYFPTRTQSRKYESIIRTGKAALACTHPEEPITVQLHGNGQEVTDEKELREVIEAFTAASTDDEALRTHWLPPVKRMHDGHFALIKIHPTWIRISDFRTEEQHGEPYAQEIAL